MTFKPYCSPATTTSARPIGVPLTLITSGSPASVALGTALHVTLDGRLVSKEITLEALFALKLGDIIPVTVGRADVLLAESRLFTAAVTEHNGTLCLTSFEDSD